MMVICPAENVKNVPPHKRRYWAYAIAENVRGPCPPTVPS